MRPRAIAGIVTIVLAGVVLGPSVFAASPGVSVGTQRAHARSDVPTADYIGVRPVKGPGGTEFKAKGYIATTCVAITIAFMDSNGTVTALGYRSALSFRFKGNIPTGAAVGPGEVQVYRWIFDPHIRRCRPGGGLVAETPFKVTEGPGIFGFSPRNGPVGTVVTIAGIRFTGTTAVKFHGVSSQFSVDSDSQITATVPVGATTGLIKILTPAGKAVSGIHFKVT